MRIIQATWVQLDTFMIDTTFQHCSSISVSFLTPTVCRWCRLIVSCFQQLTTLKSQRLQIEPQARTDIYITSADEEYSGA
jgi:hypothetical protein